MIKITRIVTLAASLGAAYAQDPGVVGIQEIEGRWAITLPGPEPFEVRRQPSTVEYARAGISLTFSTWPEQGNLRREQRYTAIRGQLPPDANDVLTFPAGPLLGVSYRRAERTSAGTRQSFHGYVIGTRGHLQIAGSLDDEAAIETARAIWLSAQELGSRSP